MLCQKGQKKIHKNIISCNAMHVKGVERHSKYAVRAHNIFAHNFLNIFNQFSIQEKFWKVES